MWGSRGGWFLRKTKAGGGLRTPRKPLVRRGKKDGGTSEGVILPEPMAQGGPAWSHEETFEEGAVFLTRGAAAFRHDTMGSRGPGRPWTRQTHARLALPVAMMASCVSA